MVASQILSARSDWG